MSNPVDHRLSLTVLEEHFQFWSSECAGNFFAVCGLFCVSLAGAFCWQFLCSILLLAILSEEEKRATVRARVCELFFLQSVFCEVTVSGLHLCIRVSGFWRLGFWKTSFGDWFSAVYQTPRKSNLMMIVGSKFCVNLLWLWNFWVVKSHSANRGSLLFCTLWIGTLGLGVWGNMNTKNQEALKLASESETSIKIDLLLQRLPLLEVTNSSRMIPRTGHSESLIMVTLIGFTR